jgi:hypothetical protein
MNFHEGSIPVTRSILKRTRKINVISNLSIINFVRMRIKVRIHALLDRLHPA